MNVLESGRILADGQPTTIGELAEKVQGLRESGGAVWYHRENAESEPPPIAMEVMKLIADNRLPVRLSKPDFSDSITSANARIEQTFHRIREKAAQHNLVILRPGGGCLLLPATDPRTAPAAVATVEKMLPSAVPRKVAVIGDTGFAADGKPSLAVAHQAVPFLGLLMGFASIGHSVWIFDAGDEVLLSAGCRDADVLIVDSAHLERLPSDWQSHATGVMKNRQILVHDRATRSFRTPRALTAPAHAPRCSASPTPEG